MVAGIVLFAFAMKATLAHVGDKLDTIPALPLCCGPALYLFAYVALRLRVSRTLCRVRLGAAVACALLLPIAVVVPALVGACARRRRLGRTPRVRNRLVARGSRTDARTARAGLRFQNGRFAWLGFSPGYGGQKVRLSGRLRLPAPSGQASPSSSREGSAPPRTSNPAPRCRRTSSDLCRPGAPFSRRSG